MKTKLFILLSLLNIYQANAQTSQQEKFELTYWNYRDRFQKQFVKIGEKAGESLPISAWMNNYGFGALGKPGFIPGVCNGTNNLTEWNMIGWGADCMATQMWQYIPVLATEYRLLRDDGKDYMPTLNELYYAMNAINRSDENAEPYYNQNAFPDLNGFFLRDDVNIAFGNQSVTNDNEISKNWRDFLVKSGDNHDKILFAGSMAHNNYTCDPTANGHNNVAEMSQDQAIGILWAMAFVRKLCMDAPTVQPNPAFPAMNFNNEAAHISHRIISYIAQEKVYKDNRLFAIAPWTPPLFSPYPIPFHDSVMIHATWMTTNPVRNKLVHAGYDSRYFAFAFNKCDQVLWGDPNFNQPDVDVIDWTPLTFYTPLVFHSDIENSGIWNGLGNYLYNNDYLNFIDFEYFTGVHLHFNQQGLSYGSGPLITLTLDFNQVNIPFPQRYVVGLALDLATISGSWSHDMVKTISGPNKNNEPVYDLAYSILHDETPLNGMALYQNLFDLAPCEGPNAGDDYWFSGNRLSKDNAGYGGEEYNGLDYCFLYNLYRLSFKNQIQSQLSTYENEACTCKENSVVGIYRYNYDLPPLNFWDFNTTSTVYRRFPEYLSFQNGTIPIKEFINRDLNIAEYNASDIPVGFISNFKIETDMIVCHNSDVQNSAPVFTTFKIGKNGSVEIGNNLNEQASLTVRKNQKLIVGENATGVTSTLTIFPNSYVKILDGATINLNKSAVIIIKDNASLAIEYGGNFNYNQGAQIILEGNNSVLKINGHFYIGDNATFTFTGNGFVQIFADWSNPNIFCGQNSKFVLIGNNKFDKVLEIENSWLNPPDHMALFSIHNGKIESNNGTAINMGCPISLQNVLMTKPANSTDQYTHFGIHVYGQATNGVSDIDIDNVEIKNGYVGLFVNTWIYAVPTTLNNLHIHDCGKSLVSQNSGLILNTINLHDNNYGWLTYGMTLPSKATDFTCENNLYNGVEYYGAETAPVTFINPFIHYNDNGISIEGSATCTVKCGSVAYNMSSGIFATANSTVVLGDGIGGTVNIHDNYNSGLHLKMIRDFSMLDGYNNLLYNYPYQLYGYIKEANYCFNQIKYTTYNSWNPPANLPVFGNEYLLYGICSNSSTQQSYIVPLSIQESNSQGFVPCAGSLWGSAQLPDCLSCGLITINGQSKKLNQHLEGIINDIDLTTEADNISAFDRLYSILKLTDQNWNETEKMLIRKSYTLISSAYGNALATHQLPNPDYENPEDSGTIYYNKLNEINEQRSTDPVYENTMNTAFDKMISTAAAMNIADQFDSASYVLEEFNTITSNTYLKVRNHWQCVSDIRQMVLDSLIQKEEFLDYIDACISSYRLEDDDEYNLNNDDELTKKLQLNLYPNPTAGNIKISLANIKGSEIICEIYNVMGVKVFEKIFTAKGEILCINQNLINLSSGNYIVHINDGIESVTSELNVVK